MKCSEMQECVEVKMTVGGKTVQVKKKKKSNDQILPQSNEHRKLLGRVFELL